MKTGKFDELDKQFATEAKHPVAMAIGYAGLSAVGLGGSAAILCCLTSPPVLVGGGALALIGIVTAGIAKGMIVNGDVKNTTDADMRKYIQSEIDEIDKEIKEHQEEIKRLEAE